MARSDQRAGGNTKAKPATKPRSNLDMFKTPGYAQEQSARTPAAPAGGGVLASYGNQPAAGGGGGGGGGYDLGGAGGAGPAIGADGGGLTPAPNPEDWLAGDAAYLAQIAALKKQSEDFGADQLSQRTRYNTDFNDALKSLGYGRGDGIGAVDDKDYDPTGGAWNETDQNTASGRAITNQLNDYASRGTLQSSLFGTAKDDLMRSLNDQLTSTVGSRKNFLGDLTKQGTTFKTENTLGQQQARAEALARMAAQYGG